MKYTLVANPPLFPQDMAVGTVDVAMLVTPGGDVVRAVILASDNATLNQLSLEAVMAWKFKPQFVGLAPGRWGKTRFAFKLDH